VARGDLDGTESMYRNALAVNEALGSRAGLAGNYDSLGRFTPELCSRSTG
jgi:hypothetical protein